VSRLPGEAEGVRPLQELNTNLQLAQLYYAPNVNYWQVGSQQKPAANHAKVYIIDDTHFYVGSDNMYMSASPQGLQEYGYLIEGQLETQQFIEDYWKPLWQNSKNHIVHIGFPKPKKDGFRVLQDQRPARRRQLRVGDIPADYPVFDLALASGDYAEPGTPWRYTT
jgi:phosphatidylserine/phosphatidylglycerophosphate/cardiolipin synthase-like enzyme